MIKRVYFSPFILVLTIAFTLNLAVVTAYADDQAPPWLQGVARMQTPSFEIKDVPAYVLYDEENIVVFPDGRLVRTNRKAVRILTREGKDEANASAMYITDSEKVTDIKAWLIRAQGPTKSYGKKEVADIAAVNNDLYNEVRVKVIDGESDSSVGDVFGYETVVEKRNIFSQSLFSFQDRLPVSDAKCVLTVPDGWKVTSTTFNYQNVEPIVNGNTYTWGLRDLKPINYEPGMPKIASLAPRLAINYFPATTSSASIQTFANWNEVGKWLASIEDPQMKIDDAIAAKAQELTANAKTEFEKIQAIAQYIQGIQYISIQIGTGRGGGYIPHPSTEVFSKSYGDCKDKANLMRALLSAAKIESYLVSIYSGDPDFVRAEWASPHQFNHCIIAIKISDQTDVPSTVNHPNLGRLLIFDSTDPYTLVGDLPEHEQGSLALVDHPTSDSLLRMPVVPSDSNRMDRTVELTLSPEGNIVGNVKESTVGQAARTFRSELRDLSAADYNKIIESWIARGASGAKTTKIDPKDDINSGRFVLGVEFTAQAYAQVMQNRLLVFKPAVIGRLERLSFSNGARVHPYKINSSAYSETVMVKLPAGFTVDEIPDATRLDSAFGKYSATYEVANGYLTFKRSLTLTRTLVPAEKYDSVENFFGRVRAAEQSPVVLVKQ